MKDVIIIAIATILLGGIGFGAGFAMAKPEAASATPASWQAKLEKATDEAEKKKIQTAQDDEKKTQTQAEHDAKMSKGETFGIVGAVVGLVLGAGANFAMGKKK